MTNVNIIHNGASSQKHPTRKISSSVMSSTTSTSSSSDDFTTDSVLAALLCAATQSVTAPAKALGGSRPGRRPNRDIGRSEGAEQIDRDYSCRDRIEEPLFSVQEFERRFTITRGIYEQLRSAICSYDSFFVQQQDCCGRQGASTDQKMCAALRLLSSGIAADTMVDYFRLGESTLLLSLKLFCRAVVACFKDVYLRRPNQSDIRAIETQYSQLGFPGCLGCVDCSGWEWDNCPVGLQGQFIGKEGTPTLRVEVVCDDKLWIWHVMFDIPGAKNDKSIVNQSTLFNDIRTGTWPQVKPRVNIAGTIIEWFYYLSDDIYPRFRIFAKPHPDPTTPKAKCYTAAHSCARKSVERVFGVLDCQFEITDKPARLADINDLSDIYHACVIMHNMIVEERGYAGTAKFRVGEGMVQTATTAYSDVQGHNCSYEQATLWREMLDPVESLLDHMTLQQALMNNIWNSHGDSQA